MNELGIALVWCSLQVTVVALVAACLYVIARRFSPWTGSLVPLTSLLVVVALSVMAFSPWPRWSDWTAAQVWENASSARGRRPTAVSDNSTNAPSAVDENSAETLDVAPTHEVEEQPATAALFWQAFVDGLGRTPVEADSSRWRWPGNLALLFLVGMGIGWLRLLSGLLAVRSHRRRSQPVGDSKLLELVDVLRAELRCRRQVEIRESDLLVTAATIGWRRPLILLPAEWTRWSKLERRIVLAHEIAHICRNDFLAWVCAQVGLVLHFYHPLVHWLASRLRLEQELAADAAAAELAGGQHRYLQTLAEMALRQADRPLAWPARNFLPTRGTFLRRIEMLRDTKQLAVTTLSRGTRVTTIGLLVLAGITVVGLRNPGNTLTQSAQAERTLRQAVEQQSSSQEKSKAFDLSYVPKNIGMMWAVRPAKVFSLPGFAPLAKGFAEDLEFKKQFGVDVNQVEQVLTVMIAQGRYRTVYLTMKKPSSFQKLIEREVGTQVERQEYNGNVYYSGTKTRPMAYFSPNRRTIILADPQSMRDVIDAGKTGAANASWSTAWKEVENEPLAAVMNMEALKEELQRALQRPLFKTLLIVAPIYQQSKSIAFGASLDKQLKLKMIADCGSDENAGSVKETVDAVLTLGKNMIFGFRQQLANRPPRQGEKALVEISLELGETFLKNAKVEQKESKVRLTSYAEGDASAKLVTVLLPSVTQARQAARMSRAKSNLKNIVLALHNYHETEGHFPAAAIMGPDGKTLHSWRVEILQYVDAAPLYEQYRMNERWDSPHNKQLLKQMPDVFRHPGAPKDSTNTAYLALVGRGMVFEGKQGKRFRDIKDGTYHTILLVEAKRDIPWTKPEDIPYDPKKPLPKLGGFSKGGFYAVFCDGHVRFISTKIWGEKLLRAMITIDGGEIVEFPQ